MTVLQNVATSLESPEVAAIEQPTRRRPLHALTTLRFIAAMYVVFYHLRFEDLFSKTSRLHHFFRSGYTGVTLFFVLSGFILAYNYPAVTARARFWVSRFARIYPVYLLAFLLMLPSAVQSLLKSHHPRLWMSVPESLLLLQAWDPKTSFLINSPAWTLSVEAFFYLLFPFILLPLTRMSRSMIALLLGIDLLIALIPALAMDPAWRVWWTTVFLGALPVLRVGTFVVGILTGARYRNKGPAGRWVLWAGTAMTLLLLMQDPPMYLSSVRDMLLSLSFGAMVYGLADVSWVGLTHPLARLLGEISYGVYILQVPVSWVMRKAGEVSVHQDLSHNTLLYIAVLLVSSYLSYRFFETPARVWIRRIL